MFKILKKVFISGILIIVFISCRNEMYDIGYVSNSNDLSGALVSEYYNHPVNWNNNIRGGIVITKGHVRQITEDGVIFRSGVVPYFHERRLICQFADTSNLHNIRKGDFIIVKGRIETIIEYDDDYKSAKLVDCEQLEH